MPLSAIINGVNTVSCLLDNDDWETLRKAVRSKEKSIVLPCCKQKGNLRKTKSGVKYFSHDRKLDCKSKPDNEHNIKVKNEIIKSCFDLGYEISTDLYNTDLQADILATKNNICIAFNVEMTKKSFDEIQKQQIQYKDKNIRGCWFLNKYPMGFTGSSYDFPIFSLSTKNNDYQVGFEWHEWDQERGLFGVADFVNLLLERKIKFCSKVISRPSQNVKIIFFTMPCWKCGKLSHVYYLKNGYYSKCGIEFGPDDMMWGNEKLCFSSEIIEKVHDFISSNSSVGQHIKLGQIKPRYSKTVGSKYMSFGCFYCDAILGRLVCNGSSIRSYL